MRSASIVLLVAALGCGHDHEQAIDPPPPVARDGVEPGAIEGPVAPESLVEPRPAATPEPRLTLRPFVGTSFHPDEAVRRLGTSAITKLVPIGRSSIVYRATLDGDAGGALKPRTVQHPRGHLAELAAYRLARLLGLDNVPPVAFRRVTRRELAAKLAPEYAHAWPEIEAWTQWDADGSVPAVAILWIPTLQPLGLDREGEMGIWRGWLSQSGRCPDEHAELCADVSTMVAFDYLIGNWDRWSGGNVDGLPSGRRLFIRDHNVAFSAPLHRDLHRRVRDHMKRAQRFSRSFVRALAGLDEQTLRDDLARAVPEGEEAPLGDAAFRDLLDRREALLSYVTALVDAYGEASVLAYP